jgi:hypothetical protein
MQYFECLAAPPSKAQKSLSFAPVHVLYLNPHIDHKLLFYPYSLLSPYLLGSVTFHSCRDRILLIGGQQ